MGLCCKTWQPRPASAAPPARARPAQRPEQHRDAVDVRASSGPAAHPLASWARWIARSARCCWGRPPGGPRETAKPRNWADRLRCALGKAKGQQAAAARNREVGPDRAGQNRDRVTDWANNARHCQNGVLRGPTKRESRDNIPCIMHGGLVWRGWRPPWPPPPGPRGHVAAGPAAGAGEGVGQGWGGGTARVLDGPRFYLLMGAGEGWGVGRK
jgi:hypothetical protein